MRVTRFVMRILRFIITVLLAGVAGMAAAQTGCGPVALPWGEDFDTYGSGAATMPACWAASHNYDLGPRPHLDTTQRHSGTAALMLYSGTLTGSHYSMAIGPEANATLSEGYYARFQYYAPTTAVALEVGVCDDTGRYTRHFVPLDTVHAAQGGRWQEVLVDLGAYGGTGRRVAFRLQRSLQAEACACYIDDLHLEGCGTSAPTVSHVAHNSLVVDWERYGAGAIQLEYNGTLVADAVAPLTLTGLQPLTTYTLRVGCSSETMQEVSVTTLPAPSLTTAWHEPFGSSLLPAGWLVPTTLQPAVEQGSLALHPTGGESCMAVLPLPADGVAVNTLTLALRMNGSAGTRLLVGVMDYGLEAGSFTPVDSLDGNGEWQLQAVSLQGYGGTGRYIALMALGEGTVRVDDVRVARCLIDNVRLYDLTDGSVTVAWDTLAPAAGTAVSIEYGSRGFTPGSGTAVAATANPFTLGGLSPSTEYDLVVTPTCGDTPCAYDRHSIATFAHEVAAPYCMNFEEGSRLPQGWVCGQGSAAIGNNSYEGLHGLHLGTNALVALPRIAVTDTLLLECYGYGSGMLEVGFMVNPYSPFEPADTLEGGSGWRHHLSTLAIPEGKVIALRSTTAWDLDALAVHNDAVTAVEVSAIGQTSAHIAWQTMRGDSVELEYRAVSSSTGEYTPGTGLRLTGLDSVNLTGLTPSTYYTLHLRPTGDGDGCLYQTVHLQTAAGAMALPYCENFDALNNLPLSWRGRSEMGEYPIVSTERNHSPGRALLFSATANRHTVALLPDFTTESQHLTMAFWTNDTLRPEGAMLLVGHLDDIANISSFVPCDTILFARSETWEHHVVDLGTARQGVALMLVGGSANETKVFIDDICLEPCVAEQVRIATLDSTEATITWESHGVGGLDIEVTGPGFALRDTFAVPPAVIQGLTPDAPYTFSFRAICECGGPGGTHYAGYGSTGKAATDQSTATTVNTRQRIVATPYCIRFEEYLTGYFPHSWRRLMGTASVSDRNYHAGNHSLIVSDSALMVLPPMDSIATLTVGLYAYASNEAGLGPGTITVGAMRAPDSIGTFVAVDSMALTRPGEWQRLWFDLSNYTGTGNYIALKIKGTAACNYFIDDLAVAPCGIGEATVDEEGTVTWQGLHGPTAVEIEYGPQGFLRGSGENHTATASPFTLPTITPGENYDVYLTPVCSDATVCLSTRLSLGASAATPYCEQFEQAPPEGMPSGWTVGRTYNSTPAIAAGSNHSMQLKGHSSATHRSIAVLPMLSHSGNLQLGMSLRATGTNVRIAVGHIGSEADPNTFVATDTLAPTAAGSWQRMASIVDLPAQRRLALCCFSVNQVEAQVLIDSLSATRGLSPTLSAISARTLAIGGTTGTIEYGPAGFLQGEGDTATLGDEGLTLGGLLPETEYWIYTREDSTTLTCMPPAHIRMPAEATLPYCIGNSTFTWLQLPEMAIDSLRHLHLYLTLDGPCRIVAGAMEHNGDWEHLVPVDTIVIPSGIRQQVHIAMERYPGNGRFAGLRSLDGTANMISLTATGCPWITAQLLDDNQLLLTGNGMAEYGLAGFVPGNGNTVTVADSLLIALDDTTLYELYPLCSSASTPCYTPFQWRTSLQASLPYCIDLGTTLPNGWTTHTDSPSGNNIRLVDNAIEIAVVPNQQASVRLPFFSESTIVADLEAYRSSANVQLMADGDTIALAPGEWQTLRLRLDGHGRPDFAATGNGTIRLRHIALNSCALPREVSIGQPGGRGVELSWDTAEADGPFYVEYQVAGSTVGTTVRADASPLLLQLLPDTTYRFYLKCDSLGTTCREPIAVATLSDPLPLPYCSTFPLSASMPTPEGWYSASDNRCRYLVMPQFDIATLQSLNVFILAHASASSPAVTLGTMLDAGNPATFDSLATLDADESGYLRFFHPLNAYYGNGRFLALRVDGNGWLNISHLSVDTCAAYAFAMTETETDHITFEWEQQGHPTVIVEYGPLGFAPGQGTVVTATTPPLRIDSLALLTDYAFYASYLIDSTNCRPSVADTFLTFTPKGGTGCIDYTDLHASYVSCKYGSYGNPTEFTGIIDNGYLSSQSRHTIHFDTTERDARTGGLLRTVPEGELASVRLGNWTASGTATPQAESITYALTVDTNDFNLLVLRYAAVLQDPEHSADLQPRFRLQILNQDNQLIDSCSMADFIANPNLHWHQAPNEVLWKDWTTVGLDLSPYGGQTIFIRLITNDCGEGSHFGYAYFTLGCSSKRLRSEGCSNVPDNRFTVPSGFNYRWYSNVDPSTLSDSASIWVPSDNSKTYYCELSFVDNPSCRFTMSAFAGARFPLAIIDTAITATNCQYDLTLTNRSTISPDGINPIGTGEPCETGLWLLPDSTTSTSTSLSFHFADTGLFDITLIAGIADEQCTDTLRRTIHIARPYPDAALAGRERRCSNEPADTLRVLNAASYSWLGGGSTPLLLNPLGDTTLTCFTVDSNGCPDTLSHTLRVLPAYSIHRDDSICNTAPNYLWTDTLIAIDQPDGILNRTRHLTTSELCDSVLTLALTLMPNFDVHHYDTLCHDSHLPFFDTTLATSGAYLHTDTTFFGCDSLVTMHLEIVPRSYATDTQVACDSLRWVDGRLYLSDTLGAIDTLLTPRGCDSVVTLDLTVHYSTYFEVKDTFCQGSQYFFRDHTLTEGGFYADTLSTMHGCDSVLAIDLTRLYLPRISIVHDYDCDTLYHHIAALSDVPYTIWSSSPYDSTLDGQEYNTIINVHPSRQTEYTLYADYEESPRCPATASVTLGPVNKPAAQMRVIPQSLVPPATEFDAYDNSPEYAERAWYINGIRQTETSRHLHAAAPEGIDTVNVTLVLNDGHCSDSAIALIPVLFSTYVAPNVFTPGADINNTFQLQTVGVLQGELRIYNRRGMLVFIATDLNQPWDGRNLNGDPCPMGSYVWVLRYNAVTRPGAHMEASGSVLLLR